MHENAVAPRQTSVAGLFSADGARRIVDKLLLKALDEALRRYGDGCLRLELPSGEVAYLGEPGSARQASLSLSRYGAIWKLLRGGALGFPESYMDGDVDTDDLVRLFEFYIDNERALTSALPSLEATRGRDRVFHASRSNTRDGSRRNIAAHYDLGNAFYRHWLDESMLYSSGIYPRPDASLETAQAVKLARILEALELEPGKRLLEIGCGWGAVAEAVARCGVSVEAITISEQQLAASRARLAAAGLGSSVDVRFEDYRDTSGSFDRLVSIEMIEAVGEENWPLYFRTVKDRLAPGGLGVIQAITIREDAFARYRQNPDFIQRYIFPGGMLPTVSLMRQRAEESGLEFEIFERFGMSYALTLRAWRQRFEAAWPQIEAMGFDDRFRRMWLYYLTYCEVGFSRGLIDVGLYRLRKPR